jgi:UDP-N-acetylmuramoylalanine--D-glutamate ligase
LGLGVSGEAAADLLLDEGVEVSIVDAGDGAALRERAARFERRGARAMLGCAADAAPAAFGEPADLAVVSPGIPADGAWVRALEARGVAVISELELGARHCRCPMLAVTGTNGKSTMVKLCAEALGLAGKRAVIAGNYGTALCEVAKRSETLDWAVVEVSSFQLERIDSFHPAVGVLLNVQPDHLDRHGTMEAYRRVKTKLFENMKATDRGIVFMEDAAGAMGAADCRWSTFGTDEGADFRYAGGYVWTPGGAGGARKIDVSGTLFDNPILGITAAAAVAVMTACGEDPLAVGDAARAFQPLPHRMTPVGMFGGVTFIDDSKGTNLAAMQAAILMCKGPVRLIAGGRLKEDNLDGVKELLAKRVKSLYVIGEGAERIGRAWSDVVACVHAGTLRRAVEAAWRDSEPGDTVLLSPACASFDQFRNYKERGEEFASCVRIIAGGQV